MTGERSRRQVLKAAVAAGGAASLSACLDVLGDESVDRPTGTDDWTTPP
ncbi:MAG: twin-arginine translocation signal domain-containing protein [Halobacteriales archaeon]|nr:twin-arginine translocation signal domain-containing protein [Halobacteriales archaeon]